MELASNLHPTGPFLTLEPTILPEVGPVKDVSRLSTLDSRLVKGRRPS